MPNRGKGGNASQLHDGGKVRIRFCLPALANASLEGMDPGLFHIARKTPSRQLEHAQVIVQPLTAHATLSQVSYTARQVLLLLTFQGRSLP
jgi:hypothetical protein